MLVTISGIQWNCASSDTVSLPSMRPFCFTSVQYRIHSSGRMLASFQGFYRLKYEKVFIQQTIKRGKISLGTRLVDCSD